MSRPRRAAAASVLILAFLTAGGCSIRRFAINKLGDALAETGATYATDDDPDLIRESLPFALKLIESLLAQSPKHKGLLLAAASGFTQYTWAFVQQDADALEDTDPPRAAALKARTRRLYRRARDYGLRGLDLTMPGFAAAVTADPAGAVARAGSEDLPMLYWTAVAWGAAIAQSKDDPEMMGDLRVVEAMLRRGLELDESFDSGALHEIMIVFEAGRSTAMGGSIDKARRHFERAMELSRGQRAAPLVDLAESVCVATQDRREFETLLRRALAIDPDARPEWRLANLVMQRRAAWLLSRADLLFAE